MRLVALLVLVLTVVACESGPAFAVPAGPPIPVALDVKFPVYTMTTLTIDEFSDELGRQLAKYNMRVVPRGPEAHLLAAINLGLWNNHQAIDVYLSHDGEPEFAGRVRVPDLAPTTLDASAQLVAPIIAQRAWGLKKKETVE
jgi:hypothetical protein